jgi:hypothetical protein
MFLIKKYNFSIHTFLFYFQENMFFLMRNIIFKAKGYYNRESKH